MKKDSLGKRIEEHEQDVWEWLTERAIRRNGPEWPDEGHRKGWENWPYPFSFSYWKYIFSDLDKGHYGGYEATRWLNPPSLRRIWSQMTEETKLERIVCRFRGHPQGEVYWNASGYEPDHHCRTCGEEIG